MTAIPIDNPSAFQTTCYKESAYGVYVSENALYLTESRPDPGLAREGTRIHKFALAGTDVRYRGSADVKGTSAGYGSTTQGQTWFGFSIK